CKRWRNTTSGGSSPDATPSGCKARTFVIPGLDCGRTTGLRLRDTSIWTEPARRITRVTQAGDGVLLEQTPPYLSWSLPRARGQGVFPAASRRRGLFSQTGQLLTIDARFDVERGKPINRGVPHPAGVPTAPLARTARVEASRRDS